MLEPALQIRQSYIPRCYRPSIAGYLMYMYAPFVCLSYSAYVRVSLSANLTLFTMRQRLLLCFIYLFASKDIFKRYRVFNRLKWTWSHNAWHTFCLLVVQNPSLLAHDHGHYCAEIRICTRLPNKAML